MVQEFHVVRCFSCQTFQVQQEFGRGSGLDCRRHVQKLNTMRGQMMDEQAAGFMWQEPEDNAAATCENTLQQDYLKKAEEPQVSRWSKYLDASVGGRDQEEQTDEEEENVSTDRKQLHGKRKRKRRDAWTDGGHGSASGTASQRPVQRNTSTIALAPRDEPIAQPAFSQPASRADPGYTSSTSGADPGYTSSTSGADPGYTSSTSGADPGYTSSTSGADPGYTSSTSGVEPGYTSSTSTHNTGASCQPRPTSTMTASKWTWFFSARCPQEDGPSTDDLHSGSGSCGEPVGGLGGAGSVTASSKLKAVVGICQSEEETTGNTTPTPMPILPSFSEAVGQQTRPTKRSYASLPASSVFSMFSTGDDFDDMW
ncbi:MRN complex-interacting protein isoform X2 [Lampris incognitus]|uniref:MRN complex-interacting protein isoform X2 n=1 Tax=Lampris incognitus TaxID=2546036 RepID=UPI0024B57747|nr:MRN complex-interacting protein isoform X2 [Lampris incognitus]